MNIKVNTDKIQGFIAAGLQEQLASEMLQHHKSVMNKTGKGNDFLGWVDLPSKTPASLLENILQDARRMQEKCEVFVVIGIGGSYLGTRALDEALKSGFGALPTGKKAPKIIYAGHHMSEDYHAALLEYLDHKEYGIAVISKSGTTTEPALAFRILKNHIENKYGKAEAVRRIIAITDKSRGALKKLAGHEGYSSYIIPDDVGGRYSVLTPVGLLPVAVAGLDILQLMKGAQVMENLNTKTGLDHPAVQYAAARNALYRQGKNVEILVNYQPNLAYVAEWWKQLYGESEGKENKGIYPASVNFTSDLHSMGQYIQEGLRIIFETTLLVEKPHKTLIIPDDPADGDGLNFLAGKRMHEVNRMAELGTMLAHTDGGVPNITVSIPQLNEYNLGQLIYFFEMACAMSGYALGVNPFDQPGVEAYKNNMFALLGKPGYEKLSEEIRKRI